MLFSEVLDETLNENFEYWSRLDAFMQALMGKIFDNLGFVAPIDAFVKQCAANAIKEELSSEPNWQKSFRDHPIVLPQHPPA